MTIDNTHVVVLRGTGRDMIPAPEMAAFGERFGFQFEAHALGNANRSGRVERPFWFIETNFLAGRKFSGWGDLNRQARQWCDKVNSTYKKHIRAVPRELFAVERTQLKPLPAWIPDVYRLHQRMVDVEGYVALHTNRYSVPLEWIGRRVEVRETKDKIEIQLDARHMIAMAVLPRPSISGFCCPSTGRRAVKAWPGPRRIRKRRASWRRFPRSPTMSPR